MLAVSAQGPHQEHPKQPPGRVGAREERGSWAQDAQDLAVQRVCNQTPGPSEW